MSQETFDSGIRSTSSFHANKLVFSPEKIAVRPTVGNDIFFSVFILFGLMALFPVWLPAVPADFTARLVFTAVGLLFAGIGLAGMLWKRGRLPEIDLMNGRFYTIPQKHARRDMTGNPALQGIPLDELETIEVAREHIASKNSYTNYRLVLEFRNGHRSCLLSHGNLKHFIADAEKLSQVLHKPLTGMEDLKGLESPHPIAGCGMMIFSIFWLIVSCALADSFFGSETWANLNMDTIVQHPEHLLIFMPILFILVGIFLLVTGIRYFVQAIKKELKKDFPGIR
ncbi:MAG: hypothetical protein IJV89_04425 [Lentisphaeria bacterium]|nr:hypothetical protein [Lentisphaeria bacterium]